ncbi:hypothetical protein FOA52_006671 [Chlamydomonas sp. UWO 241]|nr:hypothetical protein FOA52_006671 [Chlamydomonas sp. UWO 241]
MNGRAVQEVMLADGAGAATAWHALGSEQPMLWTGTAEEASACSTDSPSPLCNPRLPSLWKVLVLSDGSVTRHLQILTGTKVEVDCLSMVNIGDELQGLPPNTHMIPGPRVQRQVLLRPGGKECAPLVYACSWWNATDVDTYLSDKSKPIWVSLSQEHVELYREVQLVYHGHSASLERLLQCEGPFWGRSYIFWHNARPLTLIYEVFSNRLLEQLGPPPPTPPTMQR